jgi:hypothetical protein
MFGALLEGIALEATGGEEATGALDPVSDALLDTIR